jgi:hypothetical protein
MSSVNLGQFLIELGKMWVPNLAAVLSKAPLDGVIRTVSAQDLADALTYLFPHKEDLVDFLKTFMKWAPPAEVIRKLPSDFLTRLVFKLLDPEGVTVLKPLVGPDLVRKLAVSDLKTLLIAAPKEIQDALQKAIDATAQEDLNRSARGVCYTAIANFVKAGPFYGTIGFEQIVTGDLSGATPPTYGRIDAPRAANGLAPSNSTITWMIPLGPNSASDNDGGDEVWIRFMLKTRIDSYGQEGGKGAKATTAGSGYVAFFPVPATTIAECLILRHAGGLLTSRQDLWASPLLLNAPTVVNLYTESHFMDPQRDFFTNPHDSITFTNGLITGHKFTGQSAAKTVIDTITAPIRSIMPSVTVTQSVAVSPTGKTTTTSTQTGPPKGP